MLHLESADSDTCKVCMVVSITPLGLDAVRCLFERMAETIVKALFMGEARAKLQP